MRRAIAHGPAQHRGRAVDTQANQSLLQGMLLQLQHVTGPFWQQIDAGTQHQAAHRLGQTAGRGGIEQYLHHFLASFIGVQLWTHGLHVVRYLLTRAWYIPGPQAFCDQGDFGVVGILFGVGQVRIAVTQVGGKKAADLGHMHPGQQHWVAGCIGAPIGSATDDL
ncbi:hypothetical protein D3C80_1512300 [compost metagenome]